VLFLVLIIIIIGVLLVSGKFKFSVGGAYNIPFFTQGDKVVSNVVSDWVSGHPIGMYSLDGKLCGEYYNDVGWFRCNEILSNKGINKCKLIGDLKESHDVFVGRQEFEGGVVYEPGAASCVPLGTYWWNGLKTKITGTYRLPTWYGWFEVNCDAGTFTASDGRSGTFDCNTQLEFRSVWNFQAIFYKEEITTTTTTTTTTSTTTTTTTTIPITTTTTTTTTLYPITTTTTYPTTTTTTIPSAPSGSLWDILRNLWCWFIGIFGFKC
jgi:hypothetical protein